MVAICGPFDCGRLPSTGSSDFIPDAVGVHRLLDCQTKSGCPAYDADVSVVWDDFTVWCGFRGGCAADMYAGADRVRHAGEGSASGSVQLARLRSNRGRFTGRRSAFFAGTRLDLPRPIIRATDAVIADCCGGWSCLCAPPIAGAFTRKRPYDPDADRRCQPRICGGPDQTAFPAACRSVGCAA